MRKSDSKRKPNQDQDITAGAELFSEAMRQLDDDTSPAAPPSAGSNDMALMVFTGVHQGAKIDLKTRALTVGRSTDCDIILQDEKVAPRHVEIRRENSKLMVVRGEGETFINGIPLTEEKAKIEPETILTIDGVHMGVAYKSSEWAPSAFPTPQKPQEEVPEEEPEPPPPGLMQKLSFLRYVLAFGVLMTIIYFAAHAAIKINPPGNDFYAQKVNEIFHAGNYPPPSITSVKEGRLEVVGYVPNEMNKNEVLAEIDKLPLNIRARIYADDSIKVSCTNYLAKMELPITSEYAGNGAVYLRGFANKSEDVNMLSEQVTRNVSGVSEVRTDITLLGEVMPAIDKILAEKKLKNKIDVEAQTEFLVASGTLDHKNKSDWSAAKQIITNRFGDVFDVDDKVAYVGTAKPSPGKIFLPITGVSLGDTPYITLKGNRVCFVGAPIVGGLKLKSIYTDHVVVTKDGNDYHYRL